MFRLQLPRRFRRTCVDCGFFAYREENPEEDFPAPATHEALPWLRDAIRKAERNPRERIRPVDGRAIEHTFCSRHLWRHVKDDAPMNVAIVEAARVSRRSCASFVAWSPGRPPTNTSLLEDEARGNRFQLRLAQLAFYGAVLGGLLAGVLGWLTGSGE